LLSILRANDDYIISIMFSNEIKYPKYIIIGGFKQ